MSVQTNGITAGKWSQVKVLGMQPVVFLVMALIFAAAIALDVVKSNFLTGFLTCMVIGGVLDFFGKNFKVFSILGGTATLCLFVPGILLSYGILPESIGKLIDGNYSYGFVDFFVAALIVGSVLGMDKKILLKVGARYFVPVLGGVVVALGLGWIIGGVTGFGSTEAVLYVVAPIMGSGVGASAVPLSQMFAAATGRDAAELLAMMVPGITVGNIFAVVFAAGLNVWGKKKKQPFQGFSGNGRILRSDENLDIGMAEKTISAKFTNLATGLVTTGTVYVLGAICAKFVPQLHLYAWAIIICGIVKIFDLAPAQVQESAGEWYEFSMSMWAPTVLVGISVSIVDINAVLAALSSPIYMLLVVVTVIAAAGTAGLIGYWMKMYFVESAMTAGLCMANSGGSGDIAVLGAGDRMNLMPFGQISSRIGGAFILALVSFLIPILL